MYLFIDNSREKELFLYYYLEERWQEKKIEGEVDLLLSIDNLLAEINSNINEVKGIGVLLGRGRFTATRIAATVANTLAYTLKIPIIGVSEPNLDDVLKKIKKAKVGILISAKYSGEANIGPRTK